MSNYFNQLKSLISKNISNNSNVKNLVSEIEKLNKEFRSKKNAWNEYIHTEKERNVKKAHAKYDQILKSISAAQKNVDKEVDHAMKIVKNSAVQVEKNLKLYKKMAVNQKSNLEKILSKKAKKPKTKARPSRARKKR